ncbi:ssm4 protein [Holotrichia oblita]|uniref:Ssm4 protein n=1 Tax=Holotrichia oblita TaxID=644536 RepID=A0ACB9SQ41_HOLOL|nr:ssm4 protein [Holotrichia oblita]
MYMYGNDKVYPSRMPYTMDAVFTKGILYVYIIYIYWVSVVTRTSASWGGPDWLERDNANQAQVPNNVAEPLDRNENHNVVAQAEQENVVAENVPEPQEDGDNNGNEENNWIPMEWDRAAEEVTWERLLGLDGSLAFLEHVFWVLSLNTLFIFIFALCPYHMGSIFLTLIKMKEYAAACHFEGLLTTLLGYCLVGFLLIILHHVAALFGLAKARRVLGLCYVVVKVSMLSVVEIGILPLVCGWWLDICSLAMFDATLKDRENSFRVAPGTSIFIHWLVGMVYVYYFASFVLLLREILRPGVLWFLRNLNDPDFSPIQEMIHLPILRHIRRLLLSAIIFGSAVLLMLWLPIRILRYILPSFLPYTISLNTDAQVNELSLELLLLQVILPALLEQSHTRTWLKGIVRSWCRIIAWILDIHSYLLGDNDGNQTNEAQQPQHPPPELNGGLGAAHQALLIRDGPTGFQPYEKPSFFAFRLFALLICICISLVICSLIALTLPVWLGRKVMALWLVGAPPPSHQITATVAQTGIKVHELYTTACVIIVPLRVPIHQTPVLFIWQDWALGVLYTKIACAVTMMGPDWFLRTAIERAYRDGIRDMHLMFILRELAAPVIISFGLSLAIPYVTAYSMVPVFVSNVQLKHYIARRIYPYLLVVGVASIIITLQIREFKKLYEHIKNDKYLVGQRLVNYDHRRVPKTQTSQ